MRKWFQKLSLENRRRNGEQEALNAFLVQSLDIIREVRFFKRDEITTDLICCEIETDVKIWFFHEEMEEWDKLIEHLNTLDDFDQNWMSEVIKPTFEASFYVAYRR